jgi:nucleotide-binding universal stress UspA family protein
MLKTILVALDDSPYSDSAAALAIDWGARHGARLLGLGILDKPHIAHPEPFPVGGSSFKKERDEALLRDAQKRVMRFLTAFEERCKAAGVALLVLEEAGDPAQCILRQSHRCDLVFVGHETHFRFETQNQPDPTLSQLLRACPRPIVVVPRTVPEGNGIVVAYGGGREVARTLQTVQLLGLARGEEIHLVSVLREEGSGSAAVDLAGEFLESHETICHVHAIKSDLEPAEAILEQVRRLKPRLLVIGAHGHHPLKDLFATSVTRAVLRHCPVPVLVGA